MYKYNIIQEDNSIKSEPAFFYKKPKEKEISNFLYEICDEIKDQFERSGILDSEDTKELLKNKSMNSINLYKVFCNSINRYKIQAYLSFGDNNTELFLDEFPLASKEETLNKKDLFFIRSLFIEFEYIKLFEYIRNKNEQSKNICINYGTLVEGWKNEVKESIIKLGHVNDLENKIIFRESLNDFKKTLIKMNQYEPNINIKNLIFKFYNHLNTLENFVKSNHYEKN